MKRTLLLPSAAAMLVAVALTAGACGDDEPDTGNGGTETASGSGTELSVEEYLTEVNKIQDDVTAVTGDIGARSEDIFVDPASARQAVSAANDVAQSAVTSLEALDPSVGAEGPHEQMVAAGKALVTAGEDLFDELRIVQAGPEFDAIVEEMEADDSPINTAINDMIEACEQMQLFVDDSQLTINLDCPEAP
jgi:hypothetical protein